MSVDFGSIRFGRQDSKPSTSERASLSPLVRMSLHAEPWTRMPDNRRQYNSRKGLQTETCMTSAVPLTHDCPVCGMPTMRRPALEILDGMPKKHSFRRRLIINFRECLLSISTMPHAVPMCREIEMELFYEVPCPAISSQHARHAHG